MNNKKLYIFLDIDGVLNNETSIRKHTIDEYHRLERIFEEKYNIRFMLPDKNILPFISMVNKLRERGYEVICVLSSTWRMLKNSVEKLNYLLYDKGIETESFIVGKTTTDNMDRGLQILQYLKENNITDPYIVIDDDTYDIVNHIPKHRVIRTTWKRGFTKNTKYIILKKFNRRK